MTCTNPIWIKNKTTGKDQLLPCGKCLACRIKKTTEWKYRLLCELPYWNYNAVFCTFTYDDEHIPKDFGLHVEDMKKFWKRLRKDLVESGRYHLSKDNKKIADLKYYCVGEYGDTEKKYWSPGCVRPHGRPHFHAIIFGLDYTETDRQLVIDNWQLCDPLRFKKVRGKEKGFAPVSADDINYVTGYCQKKLSGDMAKEEYGTARPPFSMVSQGLGLRYCMDNAERLKGGFVTLNGNKISVPRYFMQKLHISDFDVSGYSAHLHQMCDYIIKTCGNTYYKYLIDCLSNGRVDLIETKYDRLREKSNRQLDLNLKAKYERKDKNNDI